MGQTEQKKLMVKFPFTWALGRFRTGKMINQYYRRSSGFSVYSFYLLLAGVVGTSVNTINLASDRPPNPGTFAPVVLSRETPLWSQRLEE